MTTHRRPRRREALDHQREWQADYRHKTEQPEAIEKRKHCRLLAHRVGHHAVSLLDSVRRAHTLISQITAERIDRIPYRRIGCAQMTHQYLLTELFAPRQHRRHERDTEIAAQIPEQ